MPWSNNIFPIEYFQVAEEIRCCKNLGRVLKKKSIGLILYRSFHDHICMNIMCLKHFYKPLILCFIHIFFWICIIISEEFMKKESMIIKILPIIVLSLCLRQINGAEPFFRYLVRVPLMLELKYFDLQKGSVF